VQIDVRDKIENVEKLTRRIANYKVETLNPPRDGGKKLLVLDIDYTLFDHRSTAENPAELMRPYLHEFLTRAYEFYDIVIWSATSMKWVEVKMRELGVLSHPEYKIMQLLDHGAMITVHTEKYGYTSTVYDMDNIPCGFSLTFRIRLVGYLIANRSGGSGQSSVVGMTRRTPSCSTICGETL